MADLDYYAGCTALTPCPDKSSLDINDFVGEAWAFLIGILIAGFVIQALQQRRNRRRYRATYQDRLEALRRVTPSVYDDDKHNGGAH